MLNSYPFKRTNPFAASFPRFAPSRTLSRSRFAGKLGNGPPRSSGELSVLLRKDRNRRVKITFLFPLYFQPLDRSVVHGASRNRRSLSTGTNVRRVYRQTRINSFCLFVYRTVAPRVTRLISTHTSYGLLVHGKRGAVYVTCTHTPAAWQLFGHYSRNVPLSAVNPPGTVSQLFSNNRHVLF